MGSSQFHVEDEENKASLVRAWGLAPDKRALAQIRLAPQLPDPTSKVTYVGLPLSIPLSTTHRDPRPSPIMSLVSGDKTNFQFILRLLNTNVDGKQKIMYALTQIKGVGRRYSNLVCKKADVDLTKRAGELTTEELERIVTILQTPTQYKIPSWFLNRQRDITDGKDTQVVSNGLDSKLREDLERLKKIRSHRGLRHYWGLRVRGQHTKTTGRRGRTVGVSKKKG
ncbi:hypothetical protein N7516_002014 [Penicillium verrucosum]|uniref:uncharacterized protein n=1 Tax=Penicillium verrucosum TaxID=60171 RepID=UPI002545350D|nr:uncharacterized protein N7516_002014 [Penicillium verrucosum]KAJ5941846.1 hypothetical protein N7516_002014 [Penicillium verrucosum]